MLSFIHNEEREETSNEPLRSILKRRQASIRAFCPWGQTLRNAHKGQGTLLAQPTGTQENYIYAAYPNEVDPPEMEDVEMLFYAQDSHDLAIFAELKDILEETVLPGSRGFIDYC